MSSAGDAFRRTFAGPSVRRSLLLALVIGTLLNAINQGPEILSGRSPVWWKLILTYFVPFAVASYGSYPAFRSADEKGRPARGALEPSHLRACGQALLICSS